MYSVLPVQSSVVFVPVAATSTPSCHTTTVPPNTFDVRYSSFIDESVDFNMAQLPPCASQSIVASSPARPTSGRSDCFVASPRTLATERSTPLKPAKRDRASDDDDRQIVRCRRSLASSLKTAAATSHLDGEDQQPPSSTSTFAASESVERRNLRERRRVKLINVTFATLRNRLPSYCWQQRQRHHHRQQQQQPRDPRQRDDESGCVGHGSAKRPSKVDTLRTAISYIRCLQDLLADDDRQRRSTFQTTGTIVSGQHWVTSPPTATGCDSYSPATSASSSSPEDLTPSSSMTAAQTSTRVDNTPVYTDEILDHSISISPISDIFDWLIWLRSFCSSSTIRSPCIIL